MYMKDILLKNKHKKYFLLQRNEFFSDKQKKIRKIFGRYLFTNIFVSYFNPIKNLNIKLNQEFKKEFDEIINYLPQKSQNILDIGSGLGIINIFLNNFYEDAYFTLIDKNYVEKKVLYGFDERGQFYNDFNITFDFLKSNGIKEEHLDLVNVDSIKKINKKFDLVISLLSLGYHYPLQQYIEFLKKNSHKKTVFIFDLAEEYNDFTIITKMFYHTTIIKKNSSVKQSYNRLCCIGLK